ncbi:LmbE family N-acetylglucosaminyl deacetylase [Motilibacter rhizosphaerae]|uniref:LmbE family N-acetylglucosaminyl deacetylase n=1 Tax=Motilibacter rhizosphaerae TaxID=598652 RepID=A0A4V2F4C8_9ACTN|nr:LmbE family N-acetylglucosaminyl deacetylase [Motilibacter rhizosphaerae]
MSFHAHPDDEALLTAGTLARAAAEGHRVVLVVATTGGAGLASSEVRAKGDLAEQRMAELRRSAAELGCARVEHLGYADSGLTPDQRAGAGPDAFAAADVDEAAARLAALLLEEEADVLTGYDASGGYGHPDHVQVHRVARRAAELAGTPVLLEATVDRGRLLRAARLVHRLPRVPAEFSPRRLATAYVESKDLTHQVDVAPYWRRKRGSMSAHASQATADEGARTLGVFLRLPAPLFRLAFRREWFVEVGRAPGRPLLDDPFATLRER